eukprot:11163305-Lingulodinium_polyedra.AAC.1
MRIAFSSLSRVFIDSRIQAPRARFGVCSCGSRSVRFARGAARGQLVLQAFRNLSGSRPFKS